MVLRSLLLALLLLAPLAGQDPRGLTERRYAGSPRVGVDAGAWHSSPIWQTSRPLVDHSFTLRQAPLGTARLRDDLNPLESYTVRQTPGGGLRIQHDSDALRSYTARPSSGGRLRITNDLNPTESWTARPTVGGYRVERDLAPWDSYSVRELPSRGWRIQHDFDPLKSYTIRRR